MTAPTCLVALPIPAPQPYRYLIPQGLADRVVPGARVVVPVRNREMVGVVVETQDENGPDLRPVLLAPDAGPLISDGLLRLARWMSRYYVAPLGLALRTMLPGALWGSSRLVAELVDAAVVPGGASREVLTALQQAEGRATAARLARALRRPVWDTLQRLARVGAIKLETEPPRLGPAAGVERVVVLTEALPSLLDRQRAFGRAEQQRAAYDAVDALGGEATWTHLRQLGFSTAVLKAMVERSVARIDEREALRDPFIGISERPPGTPTSSQQDAIKQLLALRDGAVGLLFGVTGSGKTLVYLEAIRDSVVDGRGAIILVPEIALPPLRL